MKQIYLFLLLSAVVGSTSLQARQLHYTTENTLLRHLTEVNQQWLFQKDLVGFLDLNLEKTTAFQNDIQRIQTHLKSVHSVLSKRSTIDLTNTQKVNRGRHLAILKSYYEAAIFPTNLYHSKRQPYFVDDFGVHCAVGYLLAQDGQTEVVEAIRKNDNYAYVHELLKYSQLETWAKANGFTINELAWIQPGYSPTTQFSIVGNGSGVDGEILCFEKSSDGETLYIGGDFTTINGIASASIASFDGTDFQAMNGLSGTIHDMKFHNGKLYVVGNFAMTQTQTPTNVAVWDGTTWTPLQNGDMQGTVYTIEALWSRLFIGGDFQKLNNSNISYLAYYDFFTQQWSNDGRANFTTVPNGFTVDSTVYDLEIVESKILVGGAFTAVAPMVSDSSYNKFTTSHLAYWDYSGEWISGFNALNSEVRSIGYLGGKLYLGGTIDNTSNSVSVLAAGVWSYSSYLGGLDDNIIHDFLEFDSNVYALGGINYTPLLGTFGTGIVQVFSNNLGNVGFDGAANTSGSVKATIEYKGQAYFGGNFSTIQNITVHNLATSNLLATNTEKVVTQETYKVWYASDNIILQSENTQTVDFTLFNANGQTIHQIKNINAQRYEIPTSNLPKGVYFYTLKNDETASTGKLAVY
jgi:hypothetical protein